MFNKLFNFLFKRNRKPEKGIVTDRMREPVTNDIGRSLTNASKVDTKRYRNGLSRGASPKAIGFWFGKGVVRPKAMCNRAFRRSQAKKA